MDLQVRVLDPTSWPQFAALVERSGGVWGGCWCLAFHTDHAGPVTTPDERRVEKERRVGAGTTHAALVLDGDQCVGWCQYGPTTELPRIKHRKAYETGLADLPDWRVTCFFVDKQRRRQGVADAALAGALEAVAAQGGGLVEGYPEDVAGRRTSASFLYSASVQLFERHGFTRTRQIGKHHWVVRRTV